MAYKNIAVIGDPIVKNFTANEAITPGHLVTLNSSGKVIKHASAGGTVTRMFALEDDPQGAEIGTAYTADNVCRVGCFRPGDEVLALLYDGETAAIGNFLESQGDGTLRVVDSDASAGDIGVGSVVGMALEAVDMSGSSGEDPSGRIRILIV